MNHNNNSMDVDKDDDDDEKKKSMNDNNNNNNNSMDIDKDDDKEDVYHSFTFDCTLISVEDAKNISTTYEYKINIEDEKKRNIDINPTEGWQIRTDIEDTNELVTDTNYNKLLHQNLINYLSNIKTKHDDLHYGLSVECKKYLLNIYGHDRDHLIEKLQKDFFDKIRKLKLNDIKFIEDVTKCAEYKSSWYTVEQITDWDQYHEKMLQKSVVYQKLWSTKKIWFGMVDDGDIKEPHILYWCRRFLSEQYKNYDETKQNNYIYKHHEQKQNDEFIELHKQNIWRYIEHNLSTKLFYEFNNSEKNKYNGILRSCWYYFKWDNNNLYNIFKEHHYDELQISKYDYYVLIKLLITTFYVLDIKVNTDEHLETYNILMRAIEINDKIILNDNLSELLHQTDNIQLKIHLCIDNVWNIFSQNTECIDNVKQLIKFNAWFDAQITNAPLYFILHEAKQKCDISPFLRTKELFLNYYQNILINNEHNNRIHQIHLLYRYIIYCISDQNTEIKPFAKWCEYIRMIHHHLIKFDKNNPSKVHDLTKPAWYYLYHCALFADISQFKRNFNGSVLYATYYSFMGNFIYGSPDEPHLKNCCAAIYNDKDDVKKLLTTKYLPPSFKKFIKEEKKFDFDVTWTEREATKCKFFLIFSDWLKQSTAIKKNNNNNKITMVANNKIFQYHLLNKIFDGLLCE